MGRYLAGYTPPDGQTKKAAVVKLQVRDFAKDTVLATLFTSEPLGEYSWDRFTTYSPLINISTTNLKIPNAVPVVIALEVTNNDRNLQIPIDDLADGFRLHVTWSPTVESHTHALTSLAGAGQVWAKPQPDGALVALVINTGSTPIKQHSLDFKKLNLSATSYTVRDIWAK